MKISVIGTGLMGGAMGTALSGKGNDVVFGARNLDSERVKKLKEMNPGALVKSIEEAIAESDVLYMAILLDPAKDLGKLHADVLKGKIIIDCMNPFPHEEVGKAIVTEIFDPNKVAKDPAEPTPPAFHVTLGSGESGAEQLAKLTGGKVVKAFNSVIFTNILDNSGFAKYGLKPVVYICSNHKEANEVAKGIADDLGFEGFILGNLEYARYLEHLAAINVYTLLKLGSLGAGIGLMRK